MSDMNIHRVVGYGVPELPAKSGQGKAEKSFSSLLRETVGAQVPQSATALAPQEKRRQIADETAQLWQTSSRQWKAESAGMGYAEGILYCEEKAVQWTEELMTSHPAMFRQWLAWEKEQMEESGLDNAILPDGFTEEDMSRWMAKDVLEYL